MSSVKITIGKTWKDDIRFLHSLRTRRPADTPFDLVEICDIIDIVIDGTNLTALVAEEAIFELVASVLESLSLIKAGKAKKGIIEFPHEPWELVLFPEGRTLLLSLYSVDRQQKIVVRDLAVHTERFERALRKVAEEMLTDLFELSDRFRTLPQVEKITASLSSLSSGSWNFSAPQKKNLPGANTHQGSTATAPGFTLSYRFRGVDKGLLHYAGEHLFDLHALLVPGVLEIDFDDQCSPLCRTYPFFAIKGLLGHCRQLFYRFENHRHEDFCLDEELPHLAMKLSAEGGRWRLRFLDLDREIWRETKVTPGQCLDAFLTIGELFAIDLLQVNEHLLVNQRFLDFQEELEKLRQWHGDLFGDNLYHEEPETYLRDLGDLEPEATSPPKSASFPWPLRQLRAFFPQRSWALRRRGIQFEGIFRASCGLVIPSEEEILVLDPQAGQPRWVRRYERDRCLGAAPAGETLVVLTEKGLVEVICLLTGELLQEIHLPVRLRSLQCLACYQKETLYVLASWDGTLVGFDRITGEVLWHHSGTTDRAHHVLFEGPLVCTQSAEGIIQALNPRSGEVLWKVRMGGKPEVPLTAHQGRIYSFTHAPRHQGATLTTLYPFTGRTAWQCRLPGFLLAAPSYQDRYMVVPLERNGESVLMGLDLESSAPGPQWQRELCSAGLEQTTPIRFFQHEDKDYGLLRTDRAQVSAFRVSDGQPLWEVIPTKETLLVAGNPDLVVVDDLVSILSEDLDLRDLSTGELVQSAPLREPPRWALFLPPFGYVFGYQKYGVDEVDHIEAVHIRHFLAEVPGSE